MDRRYLLLHWQPVKLQALIVIATLRLMSMQDPHHALRCVIDQLFRWPHITSLVISYTGIDLPFGFSTSFMGFLTDGRMASIQHLMLPWSFVRGSRFMVGVSV